MRIAPVSMNQHKSQSFGTLHFELDKDSRQLYYDLCKRKGHNDANVVDNIGALNKTIAEMEEKTDKQVQWYLNQKPETRHLLAQDVWPEKTPVSLSIRKEMNGDTEDLIATIAGEYEVIADDLDSLSPYNPNRRYNEIDYRAFLYRLPKVSFILDKLIIPSVEEKPLYKAAIKQNELRKNMDPDMLAEDLRADINEWLG